MTALSIHLPEKLAIASQEVAEKLGISRTEFIRQALIHELEDYHSRQEQEAMATCFVMMKKRSRYKKELDEIEEGFGASQLPEDEEGWWTGKK